jgi:hypothetical protein
VEGAHALQLVAADGQRQRFHHRGHHCGAARQVEPLELGWAHAGLGDGLREARANALDRRGRRALELGARHGLVDLDARIGEREAGRVQARELALGAVDRLEDLKAEAIFDQAQQAVELVAVGGHEREAADRAQHFQRLWPIEQAQLGGCAQSLEQRLRKGQHVAAEGQAIGDLAAEVYGDAVAHQPSVECVACDGDAADGQHLRLLSLETCHGKVAGSAAEIGHCEQLVRLA